MENSIDCAGKLVVMGVDIRGFVECRAWPDVWDSRWQAAIDLCLLYSARNYDAFGCLFGVQNYANFRPIAPDRGLPAEVSDSVRAQFERQSQLPDQTFGSTWITWAEVQAIDWDELAEAPDSRVHRYRHTATGLTYVGKGAWDRDFAEALGLGPRRPIRVKRGPRDASGTLAIRSSGLRRCAAAMPSRRTANGNPSGPSWPRWLRCTVTTTSDWLPGSTGDLRSAGCSTG